jgi:hypothetical protein
MKTLSHFTASVLAAFAEMGAWKRLRGLVASSIAVEPVTVFATVRRALFGVAHLTVIHPGLGKPSVGHVGYGLPTKIRVTAVQSRMQVSPRLLASAPSCSH